MNSVFKLLIATVVFAVLLYIVLQFFSIPKSNPSANISQQILLAQKDSGNPHCDKIDLSKDQSLSSSNIENQNLLKDLNIFVWLASLNPKYKITSLNNKFSFNTNKNYKNLDFCTICLPKLIFPKNIRNTISPKTLVCEVILDSKLNKLDYQFVKFSKNESQGFNKISIHSFPANYIYKIYIFDNQKNNPITKDVISSFKFSDYNLEKEISLNKSQISKDYNLEIPFAGHKIILQALIPSNISNISNFGYVILQSAFDVQSINVVPNTDYLKRHCITTTTEIQGINYDKQMCEVYNYCEGCFLPSDCSDAWSSKGIQTEEASSTYAISYGPLSLCK